MRLWPNSRVKADEDCVTYIDRADEDTTCIDMDGVPLRPIIHLIVTPSDQPSVTACGQEMQSAAGMRLDELGALSFAEVLPQVTGTLNGEPWRGCQACLQAEASMLATDECEVAL